MNDEQYHDLREALNEDLTDEWAPHVAVIAHLNRAHHQEELTVVVAGTLTVLKRLVEEATLVPGEIDLDKG